MPPKQTKAKQPAKQSIKQSRAQEDITKHSKPEDNDNEIEIDENEDDISDVDTDAASDNDEEQEDDREDEDDDDKNEDNKNDDDEKNTCLYKYNDQGDEDDDEEYDDEPDNILERLEGVPQKDDPVTDPKLKKTRPILYHYEYVRLLTTRTTQLAQGAKPMLKNTKNLTSKQIAIEEIKHRTIPLKILRPVNNGYEEWKIIEFKNIDKIMKKLKL